MTEKFKGKLFILSILGLVAAGCGTTGSVQEEPLPPGSNNTEEAPELSEEFIDILNDNRSELDDVFANNNNIPAFFLQEIETGPERDIGDPDAGYRVQIISTRNVETADSVADTFRLWADRHIIGYFPQTYVTFDQPYYKVHVGNFHFQQKAVEFTQMIKTRYPSAWVVYDQIDPRAVPRQEIRVVEN